MLSDGDEYYVFNWKFIKQQLKKELMPGQTKANICKRLEKLCHVKVLLPHIDDVGRESKQHFKVGEGFFKLFYRRDEDDTLENSKKFLTNYKYISEHNKKVSRRNRSLHKDAVSEERKEEQRKKQERAKAKELKKLKRMESDQINIDALIQLDKDLQNKRDKVINDYKDAYKICRDIIFVKNEDKAMIINEKNAFDMINEALKDCTLNTSIRYMITMEMYNQLGFQNPNFYQYRLENIDDKILDLDKHVDEILKEYGCFNHGIDLKKDNPFDRVEMENPFETDYYRDIFNDGKINKDKYDNQVPF